MNLVRIKGGVPIGAPRDWNEAQHGHCSTLFVRLDQDADGLRFMRSAWEPTPLELACIVAGAAVLPGINAPAHPVINMTVGPVPEDFEPVMTVRSVPSRMNQTPAVRVEMMWAKPGEPMRHIFSEALINGGSRASAVALAIEDIEALATVKGWL